MTPEEMNWLRLGRVSASSLASTSRATQRAARLVEAVGERLSSPVNGDLHKSLSWSPTHGGFVGQPLPGGERAFLDIRWMRVGLRAPDGDSLMGYELEGQGVADALTALAEGLSAAGYALEGGLSVPKGLSNGLGVFESVETARARELARWFHNGTLLLFKVATALNLSVTEGRCWSDRFGLSLSTPDGLRFGLLAAGEGEMCPNLFVEGEATRDLAALQGDGRWSRAGEKVIARLPASALLELSEAADQEALSVHFLTTGVQQLSAD